MPFSFFLEGVSGFTAYRKCMFHCFQKHSRICWGVCKPCISLKNNGKNWIFNKPSLWLWRPKERPWSEPYSFTKSVIPCSYKVCSNSIRIGIIVVVHWVGCVCNQSWHVCTYLSNSWHKLQVAAFAQVAVVGCGSNTCVCVTAIFTMCESNKQRICIKFCFKIGKPVTETYQLLQQAYGEDAMGHTQVFDWFHRFKEGRTSVESDPCSGRPSTSRNKEMIPKVRTVVRNNRRLTVQ